MKLCVTEYADGTHYVSYHTHVDLTHARLEEWLDGVIEAITHTKLANIEDASWGTTLTSGEVWLNGYIRDADDGIWALALFRRAVRDSFRAVGGANEVPGKDE